MRVDSSPGEDGVHNQFLKNLSSKGLGLLLKMAVITMIPKKELNSSNYVDYRPISLLSCICKLAERIIKNRLYSYLDYNKLLMNAQSGFRNNRSHRQLNFMTQKLIRFIKSFLSDRTFRVKINNTISELHLVTCSVPQGSVLGPLLFLVFIDDVLVGYSLNQKL